MTYKSLIFVALIRTCLIFFVLILLWNSFVVLEKYYIIQDDRLIIFFTVIKQTYPYVLVSRSLEIRSDFVFQSFDCGRFVLIDSNKTYLKFWLAIRFYHTSRLIFFYLFSFIFLFIDKRVKELRTLQPMCALHWQRARNV